jgi:hypothetical protein
LPQNVMTSTYTNGESIKKAFVTNDDAIRIKSVAASSKAAIP